MKLGIIFDNFSIFVQNNPTLSKVDPVHHNPNPPYMSDKVVGYYSKFSYHKPLGIEEMVLLF